MFWMVDSIIKRKNDVRYKKKNDSPPRRNKHKHKQRVYLPLADLERNATVDTAVDQTSTTEEHSLMCSDNEFSTELHNDR